MDSKTSKLLALGLSIMIFGGLGFVIGFFSRKAPERDNKYYDSLLNDYDPKFDSMLRDDINIQNMRNHLKYLTSIPHMAGTEGDKISADYVYNEWKAQKLDSVEMIDYNVYLSFPDDNKFNSIEIKDAQGKVQETHEIIEPTYDPELNYTGIPKPFLAYGLGGSVQSDEIYYANYCREEDFDQLASLGLNVSGKLVMCRYGQIFRGNKALFAESFGAKGFLLYSDPDQVAPTYRDNYVYPSGEFLPEKGVQRGSIFVKNGDPLTPEYPSTSSAFRQNENDFSKIGLPNIVAQVIGYGVARRIFELIAGNRPVAASWQGGLNVTYTYGGKLLNQQSIDLNVFNERRNSPIYNVMAIIKGSVEPDQYVMFGNHRDSWSFGSVDPNSGTASMLEVSRVLMNMKLNKGWMPKRSIVFLSWSGEEYGLIGSTEWVEEYKKKLISNGVVYFNLDCVSRGNYSYFTAASPLIFDLLYQVTKSVSLTKDESVYDRWVKNQPDKYNQSLPAISPYLGANSDHMAFVQKTGIPSIDESYVRSKDDPYYKSAGFKSFAAYHSSYETYRLVNEFIDPQFTSFKIISEITGKLVRKVSDSLILPFNALTYAKQVQREYQMFQDTYGNKLASLDIDLKPFQSSVELFVQEADQFHKRLASIDRTKYHLVRMYNQQLRSLEYAFVDPYGIERDGYQHMIFAPSLSDSYGGDSFPSLTDAIYNYNKAPTKENTNKIREAMSIIIYTINSASYLLKEPHDFQQA